MNKSEKRTIKIVRKNTAVSPPANALCASNHSISAAVDGWILERDQNRMGQMVSSHASIQKWKALPDCNASDGVNVPEDDTHLQQ